MIGERAHATSLTLIDTLANMPAHLLSPDITLVIANRALVDSLVHPLCRTVYHSHLHNLAMAQGGTFSIHPRRLFTTAH
ncbi:hypothetical protein BOTBODRAFT_177344 [Botryobasidium botryosum FD-172 SS1]|uniref:Uncharacterized protein n=1 Tax=Botryobasidium botryosum (strain FD-172 SS1) TaxID=930990 RepID=A0A067M9C7_BOTB1|nr:hypothetical protein BOTBODRAFT_177344 [Botryobasidium botryosum FD-172 SS1]